MHSDHRARRRGFTIMELMIVVTIMGVLIAIPAPMFGRAIEQSKLDVAAANLRSIWAAERLYRLENPQYGDLPDPANPLAPGNLAADLIDPTIVSGTGFYSYIVTPTTDSNNQPGFLATATRSVNSVCSGTLTIDQTGTLNWNVTYAGQPMAPSMEKP